MALLTMAKFGIILVFFFPTPPSFSKVSLYPSASKSCVRPSLPLLISVATTHPTIWSTHNLINRGFRDGTTSPFRTAPAPRHFFITQLHKRIGRCATPADGWSCAQRPDQNVVRPLDSTPHNPTNSCSRGGKIIPMFASRIPVHNFPNHFEVFMFRMEGKCRFKKYAWKYLQCFGTHPLPVHSVVGEMNETVDRPFVSDPFPSHTSPRSSYCPGCSQFKGTRTFINFSQP